MRPPLDLEAVTSREPHRPQRTQMILLQPMLGIAHRPQYPRLNVSTAIDKVDHLAVGPARHWIKEQRINREVPAARIHLRRRVLDAVRATRIAVHPIAAEARHLDRRPVVPHQHHAEGRAHRRGLAKIRRDLLRACIGRDIVILRLMPQQQVPNTTARKVRDMIAPAQRFHHPHCRVAFAHPICSSRNSRLISIAIASTGSRCSNSTACTASVMGMSTRYFLARSTTDSVVATPSTTHIASRR